MTATAAEALELALWLHRAPARRAALLGRPLPDGIGLLLRVAGGAHDQVAAAATITGEDEATVLEAVRFYLQQILFHDEADAWRVLGLRPGAPQSQAREHHRLLQQWLHPDRRGPDDWESVYATRVNRAWSDLKSGNLQGSSRQGGEAVPVASRSRFSGDHPIPSPATFTARRSRSKTATLLVLLACIGLVIAIALRNDTPPEWRDPRAILVSAGPSTPPPTAIGADSEVPDGAALLASLERLALEAAQQAEAARAAITKPVATAIMEPVAALATPAVAAPSTPAPVMVRTERQSASAGVVTPDAPMGSLPVTPESEPATVQAAPPTVLLAAAEPASIAPVPEPAVSRVTPIPDAYARMTQARARARMVSEYLADPSATPPPVWNDLATLQQAQRIRVQLHRRLGTDRVALKWQDPQWRLNADGAWLQTAYQAANEEGTLKIAFTWREDQLLVESVDLDPGA